VAVKKTCDGWSFIPGGASGGLLLSLVFSLLADRKQGAVHGHVDCCARFVLVAERGRIQWGDVCRRLRRFALIFRDCRVWTIGAQEVPRWVQFGCWSGRRPGRSGHSYAGRGESGFLGKKNDWLSLIFTFTGGAEINFVAG